MTDGVVYEVRLEINTDIEQEYDAWLAGHIEEMLRFDGFMGAEVLVPDTGEPPTPALPPEGGGSDSPRRGEGANRVVRQVQYRVASRQQLDDYFTDHASRMRDQGVQRFGDKFSATRRIYQAGGKPLRSCQNCGATLHGQYCEDCGQRDKHQIISLWELLSDLFGDLFEFDSRVWRTLRPLLLKPGLLTTEYLRGRRVHYTPPFRLYLVSSLIFFLVVFFNAAPELNINGDAGIDQAREALAALQEASSDAETDQALADLTQAAGEPDTVEFAIFLANLRSASSAKEFEQALSALAQATGDPDIADLAKSLITQANVTDATNGDGPVSADSNAGSDPEVESDPASDTEPNLDLGSLGDQCARLNVEGSPGVEALAARGQQVCRKLTAEGGATRFLRDLVDNTPGMMFFFLPVVALIMAFLYPFSRRYYVEHLLFFVHYHSFFFLIMTLTVFFSRLPHLLPGQGFFSGLLRAVVIIYIPIYLFVAMRRVYAQSFALTAVKYGLLGIAYSTCLLVSFMIMVLFTAFSI